ncbi:MAG: hypothetical protein RIS94_3392, partial [Pseudomonadota bacterium]
CIAPEPLVERQAAQWDPLLDWARKRYDIHFEIATGIMHRPQPAATLEVLRAELEKLDAFALAALRNTTSLSCSLTLGLAAIEPDADVDALWDAANLEEDWQAELWGKDAEALERRALRHKAFAASGRFAALARG